MKTNKTIKRIVSAIISTMMIVLSVITPTASAYWYYTPVEGDTWGIVSLKTDTDKKLILAANNVSEYDLLYAGVPIVIPDDYAELNTGFINYTGNHSDNYYGPTKDTYSNTYYGPAKEVKEPEFYDKNGNRVYWDNNNTTFVQNPVPTTTTYVEDTTIYETYKVQWGDSWSSIAYKTGFDMMSIVNVNGKSVYDPIYAGQTIELPIAASSTSSDTSIEPSTEETTTTITTLDNNEYEIKNNYDSTVIKEVFLGARTLYNNPWTDSWHNIKQAAKMLNEVTVMPGATFSFYWHFYPGGCNAAQGFIPAPAYGSGGIIIYVEGGGICFVSTTFFQCAVLVCGLQPVERNNHIRAVSYATVKVDDAAVDLWDDPNMRQDMQFRNTRNNPVKFYFYADDSTGALTVECYELIG